MTTTPLDVLGVDVRLPGFSTWDHALAALAAGWSNSGSFPAGRLRDAGLPGDADDCPSGGYLERIDMFDHRRFRVPRRIAEQMDPFQRLCLTAAEYALADAGLDSARLRGSRTGVFAAVNTIQQAGYEALLRSHGVAPDLMAVLSSSVAARISFVHDLRGPAVMVDSACSSSLEALALAADHLSCGRIDLAIVVGANLYLDPGRRGDAAVNVLSATGQIRAFDAGADGTRSGEGVVAVVLARAGDGVPTAAAHGQLLSWSTTQDGTTATMAGPNPEAQVTVVEEAWASVDSVPGLIIAHGTGTVVGDDIELASLTRAGVLGDLPRASVPLVSVKGTFGHLDAASGLLSFVMALASSRSGLTPAHPLFTAPAPTLDLAASPFFIPVEPEKIRAGSAVGVSSFGMTGTNVHVVVVGDPDSVGAARPPRPELSESRCWFTPGGNSFDRRLANVRDVLGTRSMELVFEPQLRWEMAEHLVDGVPLMVGTACYEIIAQLLGADAAGARLRQLHLLHPLSSAAGRFDILAAVRDGDGRGELRTRTGDEDSWQPWVTFHVAEPGTDGADASGTSVVEPSSGSWLELDTSTSLGDSGTVSVSPRWNVVRTLELHDDRRTARVSLATPADQRVAARDYLLHPALLDAALNAANTTFAPGELLFPWMADEVRFGALDRVGDASTSLIALRELTRDERGNVVLTLDVDVTDSHGELVLAVRGYRTKNRPVSSSTASPGGVAPRFQRLDWTDVSIAARAEPIATVILDPRADATWPLQTLSRVDDLRRMPHPVRVIIPVPAGGPGLMKVTTDPARTAWVWGRTMLDVRAAGGSEVVLVGTGLIAGPCGSSAAPDRRAAAMTALSVGRECGLAVAAVDAELDGDVLDQVLGSRLSGPFGLTDTGLLVSPRWLPVAEPSSAGAVPPGTTLVVGASRGIGRAYASSLALTRSHVLGCGRSEVTGASYEYRQVDVTDADAVHRLADELRDRGELVRTVVMFAGEPGSGLFVTKDCATFTDRAASKIVGSLVLRSAFPDADLVLVTSVAGWLGAMGQAEYVAANAFQQGMVGGRTRVLALGAWEGIGMAAGLSDPVFEATTPELGIPLIDAFVRSDATDLALFAVTDAGRAYSPLMRPDQAAKPLPSIAPAVEGTRPAIRRSADRDLVRVGPDPTGFTDSQRAGLVEERVRAAWARALGEDSYRTDVSFFDYGGDSVSIVALCDELNREFGEVFDVTTLFSSATIAAQAALAHTVARKSPTTATPTVDITQLRNFLVSRPLEGTLR